MTGRLWYGAAYNAVLGFGSRVSRDRWAMGVEGRAPIPASEAGRIAALLTGRSKRAALAELRGSPDLAIRAVPR